MCEGWELDEERQHKLSKLVDKKNKMPKEVFEKELMKSRHGKITTEICAAPEFYYAEDYHQQYLGKNPNGYCGLGGTGVSCPVGALEKA